jgi:Tol biopolymer transport system component
MLGEDVRMLSASPHRAGSLKLCCLVLLTVGPVVGSGIRMKLRFELTITIICLFVLSFGSCRANLARGERVSLAEQPASATDQRPLIAFLQEGNLWASQSDGANRRLLAIAPEGEAIQDFVWSLDGSRIYFPIGSQFFEVVTQTGNVANAGELSGPSGVSVDRLEMGRDGNTIIVHALDANASPRLLGMTIGQRESRELSLDEYNSLTLAVSPVVRSVGEMSVSPNGRLVLFKGLVSTGEELFMADVETGARVQITNLYALEGFEESVETEGGRRVLEASWSPDGRSVIFIPMQSCSETGLCYGRLYLVETWGGAQLQLSIEMMINAPLEWTRDGKMLVYDDGSKVVVTDTKGNPRSLSEGNHPKWQPAQ